MPVPVPAQVGKRETLVRRRVDLPDHRPLRALEKRHQQPIAARPIGVEAHIQDIDCLLERGDSGGVPRQRMHTGNGIVPQGPDLVS